MAKNQLQNELEPINSKHWLRRLHFCRQAGRPGDVRTADASVRERRSAGFLRTRTDANLVPWNPYRMYYFL